MAGSAVMRSYVGFREGVGRGSTEAQILKCLF